MLCTQHGQQVAQEDSLDVDMSSSQPVQVSKHTQPIIVTSYIRTRIFTARTHAGLLHAVHHYYALRAVSHVHSVTVADHMFTVYFRVVQTRVTPLMILAAATADTSCHC
jgi:hypothetical protein